MLKSNKVRLVPLGLALINLALLSVAIVVGGNFKHFYVNLSLLISLVSVILMLTIAGARK